MPACWQPEQWHASKHHMPAARAAKSEADIEESQRTLRAAQMPACVAAQCQQHAVQWQMQIARSAQTPTCAGAKANKMLCGCRLPGLCPT